MSVTKYQLSDVQFFRRKYGGGIFQGIITRRKDTIYCTEVLLDIPQVTPHNQIIGISVHSITPDEHLYMPTFTHPSQRRLYQPGESILFAVKHDRFTEFCKAFVAECIPEKGCSIITPLSRIIPFNCIYPASPDWHVFHKRCRETIITWLCCVKNVLCKDVRSIIAPQVWQTRDDPEWEENNEKFKEAARKRLRNAKKRSK